MKKKFLSLVYVLIKMDTSSLKINYLFLVIIQILKNNNSIQKDIEYFYMFLKTKWGVGDLWSIWMKYC